MYNKKTPDGYYDFAKRLKSEHNPTIQDWIVFIIILSFSAFLAGLLGAIIFNL